MKPFFTLCMILTVIQVLSVINGVSSDTDPAPPKKTVKRTTTTTSNSKTSTQRQKQQQQQQQQQPQTVDQVDDYAAAADDDGPLPTDVKGASVRLAKTAGQQTSRRAADVVNGGTGLMNMGGGLMGLLSGLVRRQAGNMRQVTREGFGMANGLGDTASRGAVRVMRNTSSLGRDVAGRMGDVADTTADTSKRFSRLGGAAVVTPISMAGDAADLGAAAVTIPKNASKKVTGCLTNTVLPKLGADKMTPLDDGRRRAEEGVREEEEMVTVEDDAA